MASTDWSYLDINMVDHEYAALYLWARRLRLRRARRDASSVLRSPRSAEAGVELDAFTTDLGRSQGRVPMPGSDGRAVLVLGDPQLRRVAELTPGDFIQAEQAVDLTDDRIVRARGSLRVPDDLPMALAWEVSLCIDGVKRAYLRVRGGQTKAIDDLAANVTRDRGMHTLAIRLELIDEGV